MGSSSKKYKEKTDRKRRHRSRSISDDESPAKRHKHKRHHHKDRRRDKKPHEFDSGDSDVVEISDHEDRNGSPPTHKQRDRSSEEPSSSSAAGASQSHDSLSIDETNKLRAKLGLRPLQVDSESSKKELGKHKDDYGEFYHKPAGNLAHTAKNEKLKNKLSVRKEKRQIENKLGRVKLLGESDSDDDASAWVNRNRKQQDLKKQAEQRAKALEELDEQFGISEVIEQETRSKHRQRYSEKNLKGLRVEHDTESFKEGKTVILTLKDQGVLDEDDDVLVNVNMKDDERYIKSVENKKKKPVYNPYDVEEVDEFGNVKQKNLLDKYDEEIDGEKRDSFQIGIEDNQQHKRQVTETIKAKLANKRLEQLNTTTLKLASDYYNEEELAKFKKPKKKVRKLRKEKMLTADDLEMKPVNSGHIKEEMKFEQKDDESLEKALKKAKRLQRERDQIASNSENFKEMLSTLSSVKSEEPDAEMSPMDSAYITLNSTAEFCRTLGDIPTYGKSGNRAENEELMDFDKDLVKDDDNSDDDCQIVEPNNWNSVEAAHSSHRHDFASEVPILDEEPDVGSGVGAALKLAMSKGYLDKEESNRPSNTRLAYLQAKHYSIEDKNHGEDGGERGGQRRERYAGPVMEFKEKDAFKPNVKLEYIDDEGHVLNSKEAFRYLSHKFHGKGPGKNKIEKRLKKTQQEGLMKKMSSTDTPLGTLNMLQAKQKEIQSPYIVLSGGKTHSTSISKARR